MLSMFFILFPLVFGQPAPATSAWSAAIDPSAPGATGTHWTVSLSAHYCGGYDLGDGVFIQPEAPLALPDPVPPDAVLFAGQSADVSVDNGVLRVAPSPGLARSMICMQGDRAFTVELLPSLGLTNPGSGNYAVDVWIGSGGAQVQLPITIADS